MHDEPTVTESSKPNMIFTMSFSDNTNEYRFDNDINDPDSLTINSSLQYALRILTVHFLQVLEQLKHISVFDSASQLRVHLNPQKSEWTLLFEPVLESSQDSSRFVAMTRVANCVCFWIPWFDAPIKVSIVE